ncbi:MAG: IcmT/TraK family protein [Gammaproteobacteria bacterium]|nr:IcmT/TraK family protein [Gammaproteobacteria bacterium]
MKVNSEAHWRDSARSIRFFIWDGKAAFPMVLFLMYMRIWTLVVAVGTMMFFTILNRYGFSPIVFLRWLRSILAGRRKMAIPWWMQ